MDLELVARELKMLAGRERLSALELDRAKSLMVELKQQGMLNPEIVELTGGRWSESTVKGYTKGVRATDPEPWKSAAALFSEMSSMNLTLAEVRQAMAITIELQDMGSSFSDVVSFIEELKQKEISLNQLAEGIKLSAELEGIGTSPSEIASFIGELKQEDFELPAFVFLFRDWHEAGLAATDARSTLNYREQLQGVGFDIEALPHIAEAAGKFGSPREVLEAVAKYGSLGELDEEVKTRREELDKELQAKREGVGILTSEIESRSQELAAAGQKLEEVQKELVAVEKSLAIYKGLEAIGFNEKVLSQLTKVADRYGAPRKVLTALNSFSDLSDIKAASEELQGKVQQQRVVLKDLEEKYSHLKLAIQMCQKLLQDHKFGLDTITSILATAKMYGEPIRVLKAIETYGALKEIKKETDQAIVRLAEIKGEIEVLKETYAEQNARNITMLNQFEVLTVKAIGVGTIVGSVQEQLKGDTLARDLLILLHNPSSASYEEYAPLVLVLLKGITVWAIMNRSKFNHPSLIDKNLQEVIGYLGGS